MSVHQQDHSTKLNKKFVLQSSDVLDECRVEVREEGSDTIIWYKDRYLSDHEIVDNLVESATSKLCWSIHRPKRGWYLRIRAPSFPPGMYIPLLPLASTSPFYVEGALMFSCLTNVSKWSSVSAKNPRHIINTEVHSYPPTSFIEQRSIIESNEDRKPLENHYTSFILCPNTTDYSSLSKTTSFITRALNALRTQKSSNSSSFTLSPMPSNDTEEAQSLGFGSDQQSLQAAHVSVPLIICHDQTPLLTFGSTVEVLQLDCDLEQQLGVERSLWIAISLSYLDFLGDREGYLAAI